MFNSAAARQSMIDGQLRPNGIVDPGVLHSFGTVPRERFASAEWQGSAYADDTLLLSDGRFLAEPLVLARLLQAAGLRPDDTVLVPGDTTGYLAALLSPLVALVVVPAIAGRLDAARQAWTALGLRNIDIAAADQDFSAFSLVIAGGAVAEAPESWLAALAPQGRLLAVLRPPGRNGTLTLIEKDGAGIFGRRALFDAELPYLPDHTPLPAFQL